MIRRLGPHVIKRTSPALDWVPVAPIVKVIDDVAVLRGARADAVQIFRKMWPNDRPPFSPTDEAAGLLAALQGYKHPRLYVEVGGNEQATKPGDGKRLAVVASELRKAGVKAAGPNWATGAYTASDFEEIRAAKLDAIALHAYWADAGPTQWNGLRWQQYWRPGDPLILVTECGRDVVRDGPSTTNGGLIGNGGWHKDAISADRYTDELVAYDAKLQADPSVLGATVFTAGPTPDWQPYEVDSLVPALVARTDRTASIPIPGGTVTPPPPGPTPGFAVGPGVLAEMQRRGDAPTSPESWNGTAFSITTGSKGLYLWVPGEGRVRFSSWSQ